MDLTDDEMSSYASETNLDMNFDSQQIADQWFKMCAGGELTSNTFRDYWREWVPKIYGPTLLCGEVINWKAVEEQANKYLFKPLEMFICNGDPAAVLRDLNQWDKPPNICGRVFKMGEPTYRCKECSMDMTCVFCVDCFKKSEHRFHKYKMSISSGGGCCDCGDAEAWKRDPCCDVHKAAAADSGGSGQQQQQQQLLPDDLKERTSKVFDTVLWYAYHLLSLENAATLRYEDFLEEDSYCTILYNDEVHTFEQVIGTISRVIKCPQKQATECVTNIDREGRAVVKCSTFVHCNDLKTEFEKITSRHGNKPLKVLVVHSREVAHQVFAMKLLSWLQEFLAHGEGFRGIFAAVALGNNAAENTSIVKGIMMRDSQLWKSARSHWHRLLMAGLLLEYENKKALAKMFTKFYGSIIKDFIKDDHDHSFSIASLSVQLFTVPTLSHHLIANDDALFILLNTFVSECSAKCNSNKKLEFDRGTSSSFKRAQYILFDLRYLLSFVPEPEQWTQSLRVSFLQGLSVMLNLLMMMQDMDVVTRQVGQHMEYEPEWETAFNLHIKLAYCVSLALKWCATDKVVLVKAYRATLKKLCTEIHDSPYYDFGDSREVRELLDYSVLCIHYDVSTKPVSIHLPLTRFLAGLHLSLEKFGLNFNSAEFECPKPNAVQIIEPVLRTKVMISQVAANMWRRNGYALLNQLYFYHNVKCRSEMLDRDVVLLQVGATFIEGNEFLIHLLNKFHLLNWTDANFETNSMTKMNEDDSMRQTVALVEEFLQLLIVIIGERYVPGISDCTVEDRIKKEVIQHLCIKPMAHSELSKTIPDDLTHETGLDDVIDQLAIFKKPLQSNGKGVYELRSQFYEEYNIFYYHYTREELSKSEEAQRNRRRAAGELDCVPPPKLPKLTQSFHMLVNLLQCDVMMHIMHTVLSRCINLKALSFSELQLHKILHLIGYALQEEESKNYPFLEFSEKATRWKLPTMLEELSTSPRVETHKPLMLWTLNKFKQVLKTEADRNQESQSNSVSDLCKEDENLKRKADKERRAKMAAERQAKIMAQMTAMQNDFIKENAQLFNQEASSDRLKEEKMDTDELKDVFPIALGPNQTSRLNVENCHICILCQEEQRVTLNGNPMVLAAFVHQSTVLCQNRNVDVNQLDPLFLNANLGPAPHTSTCGHVMHSTCWQRYFDNVMTKEHRRPYRLRHPASFDVDKQEFLCPLCECISNTVLPLVPSLCSIQPPLKTTLFGFEDWLQCMDFVTTKKVKVTDCNACENASNSGTEPDSPTECDSNCGVSWHQMYTSPSQKHLATDLGEKSSAFLSIFPTSHPELTSGLKEMIQNYTQVTYTRGLKVNPHPADRRLACMAWKSCSYTVHSIETILRDSNKPLLGHLSSRHRDCLESLVRIMGVLGATWPPSNCIINVNALRLLTMLFEHGNDGYSILRWDTFGVLVPLTFSLPSLFCKDDPTPIPTGGILEQYTLRLLFVSHIVKVLITSDFSEIVSDIDMTNESPSCSSSSSSSSSSNTQILMEILELLNKKCPGVSSDAIWDHVKYACMPFLRCCALFYHYLTDVPAPALLTEIGGDTFENICSYLDLPKSPTELFPTDSNIMLLVKKWCTHEEVRKYLDNKLEADWMPPKEPLPINKLVDLPYDYSELINISSSCPNSDEDSRNPTMCLVCGEVLCSQSYCCQREVDKINIGACNYHAHKCGAGVGIFLRVRECEIMYLATPHRGCFVSPPYLDEYGETDQGLRRGNALHLCRERYKKLQSQWLNHSILEEIARFIETTSNIIPPQWQHL